MRCRTFSQGKEVIEGGENRQNPGSEKKENQTCEGRAGGVGRLRKKLFTSKEGAYVRGGAEGGKNSFRVARGSSASHGLSLTEGRNRELEELFGGLQRRGKQIFEGEKEAKNWTTELQADSKDDLLCKEKI